MLRTKVVDLIERETSLRQKLFPLYSNKLSFMDSSYSPVAHEYKEVIEEEIGKHTEGKIFYFDSANEVASAEGKIKALSEINGKGWFIEMDSAMSIRIDRIITFFGKPGAAYDEYDAFANACMDCSGGD